MKKLLFDFLELNNMFKASALTINVLVVRSMMMSMHNDLNYEFNALQRRSKFNVAIPSIAMEVRAEKALEAVYVCCFRREAIEEEDKRLLITMLSAVFPSVKPAEIERIVKDKARKVAEGSDENGFPEPKPLPEEAVKLQMKDLQFLQQNRDT